MSFFRGWNQTTSQETKDESMIKNKKPAIQKCLIRAWDQNRVEISKMNQWKSSRQIPRSKSRSLEPAAGGSVQRSKVFSHDFLRKKKKIQEKILCHIFAPSLTICHYSRLLWAALSCNHVLSTFQVIKLFIFTCFPD